MALRVRRVVTGHDKDGRAIAKIDEMSQEPALGAAGRDRLRRVDQPGLPGRQYRRGG